MPLGLFRWGLYKLQVQEGAWEIPIGQLPENRKPVELRVTACTKNATRLHLEKLR